MSLGRFRIGNMELRDSYRMDVHFWPRSLFSLLVIFNFLALCNGLPSPQTLVVRQSGMGALHPSETSLSFYLVLENVGGEIIDELYTKHARCCIYQPLPDKTNNCIRVDLLGDQAFNLSPGKTCTLVVVYPTLYIFDRTGECKIDIEYQIADSDPASVKHIVSFDTSNIAHFWMPNAVKLWFLGYEDCDSVDHDRLRSCHPVYCALKYHGQRNFYNASSKRCEPLTLCMSDDTQSLPSVAYQRRSNTCKDLAFNLTNEDLEFLTGSQPPVKYDQHDPMTIYQYVCLHGKSRDDHSGCVCEPGWRTKEEDYMKTNPDTDMIHMCDTPYLNQDIDIKRKPTQIALIVLGSLCGALLTVVAALSFFTWWKTQSPSVRDHVADELEKRPLYPATISMEHITAQSSRSSLHRVSQSSLNSLKDSSRYESARVHTPNMPLTLSELDLRVGDVITDLQETDVPGLWKGFCNGSKGTFPVCCAELYRHGYGPKPTD